MHDAARSHRCPPATRAPAILALVAACALPACSAAARLPVAADDGTPVARAASLCARADAATDALVARFWDAGAADFALASPSTGEAAGYWITHRYLAALAEVADVPGVPALLAADAEAAWSVARDPASGLFGVDWGAPAGAGASLAAQTSAATALGVEASRAAARAR